jgi:hypothetical protein
VWEDDESFSFTLSNPTGVLIGDGTATGTVLEDEAFPSVTWALASAATGEADVAVEIEAVLDPPSAFPASVDYAVTGGTASSGADYQTLPAGTLGFAAGSTSESVTLTILEDDLGEADETVQISLSSAFGATLVSPITHVHTIIDGDAKVSFATGSTTVDESAGAVDVEVVLSQPVTTETVTVDYALTGGSASTADYAFTAGTVTFAPGDTSETFTVTVLEDDIDEPSENIVLGISSAVNATVFAPSSHIFTINDNDPPPAVSFDATESTVGEADGSVTVGFTLANPSWRTVTVNVSASGGTASAGDDYSPAAWNIPVPAGDLVGSLTVDIIDDDDDNPDLTTELTITSVTFGQVGAPSVHTVTILDDEEACLSLVAAQISTDTAPGPSQGAVGGGLFLAFGGARRTRRNRAERRWQRNARARAGQTAVLLAVLLGAALAMGAAASLGVSSFDLGSGGTEVPGCDPDGVSVTYGLDPTDFRIIDEVVVHDLDASLTGHRLYVVVADSAGQPLAGGSGSTTFDGTSSMAVAIPGCTAADAATVTVTVNEEAP